MTVSLSLREVRRERTTSKTPFSLILAVFFYKKSGDRSHLDLRLPGPRHTLMCCPQRVKNVSIVFFWPRCLPKEQRSLLFFQFHHHHLQQKFAWRKKKGDAPAKNKQKNKKKRGKNSSKKTHKEKKSAKQTNKQTERNKKKQKETKKKKTLTPLFVEDGR